MTQTAQTTLVAGTPRVNLLPPEIAEAARFRQIQIVMGGAVVLSAAVVGLLYMHAKSEVSTAQSTLDTAQSQHVGLQAKLNGLADVQQTYAAVQAKQALLTTAMGSEIRWSYQLNDLSLRIPSDVWLTSVTAAETSGTPTAAATTPTATTGSGIGTISFSGTAYKHDDVATWLDVLAREKGYADPSFASSTEAQIGSRKVVNFASSVSLTPSVLSNRYTKSAGN